MVRHSVLVLENVSKAFPGVQALHEVTLDVAAGEIHGLVGENGAGKSTLMAIASGAMTPDSGQVLIDHDPLAGGDPAQARERGLAIVRQEPSLIPDLTVAENLWLGVAPRHRPARPFRIDRWARRCLSYWRTDHGIDPSARVVSLSQEQRFVVEICKALAQEPKVLVLDEPTEHLVPDDIEVLFDRVRELAAGGCAIVYISHRIREVQRLVDRVTVLRDGLDQGTHEIGSVSERQIVDLIVGRSLDSAFPAKPETDDEAPVVLELQGFQAAGCAPVDLSIRRGEIVGLAGIDGNGQREFLRGLAGLNQPTGTVVVNGTPVASRRPHQAAAAGIAYLTNDRHREGVLAESSVRENVALRSLSRFADLGFVRSERETSAATSAVRLLDVKTPSVDTLVGTLSGGNQQKTVLAGALGTDPRVLLADEPTQGVDVGARVEIYAILRRQAEAGAAVLILASDPMEVAGVCDRVLVFSRGHVAAQLSGEEVTEHRITEAILTSTTTREGAGRPAIGRRWRRTGWLDSDWTPAMLVTAAIIGLCAYAANDNELFLSERNLQGVLALTATLALVGAAQQLVMLIGGIDLSVGPLMGMLVVVASFFLVDGTAPGRQAVGWVLLVTVAVTAGVVNWALVELARLPAMVATLVTFMAFQGISLLLRPTPGGLISVSIMDTIGARLGPIPLTLLLAVAVILVLQLLLTKSRWGLSLRGVGSDPRAARLATVRPRLVSLSAHVGCSALAGLAAIPLIAQVGSGDPTAGVDYTLASVAAAVIGGASVFGGRGSFVGCLLGALLIQEVASVTTFLQLTSAWQSYLLGGMILVAVSTYSKGRQLAQAPR